MTIGYICYICLDPNFIKPKGKAYDIQFFSWTQLILSDRYTAGIQATLI